MKHRLSRRFSVVSNDIINNDNGEHDDLAKKSFQRFILHLIHNQQVAGGGFALLVLPGQELSETTDMVRRH